MNAIANGACLIVEQHVPMSDRNGSLETNESSLPDTQHGSAGGPMTVGDDAALSERSVAVTGDDASQQQPPPQQQQHSQAVTGLNQLDFNNLFTLENIPGLSVSKRCVCAHAASLANCMLTRCRWQVCY